MQETGAEGGGKCVRGKVREVRPEERAELSFPYKELNIF